MTTLKINFKEWFYWRFEKIEDFDFDYIKDILINGTQPLYTIITNNISYQKYTGYLLAKHILNINDLDILYNEDQEIDLSEKFKIEWII